MANYYGQYPDIYSTDDPRSTYVYDSGERVTLIAGEDGVTQEWIHALKLEHRREYNMMRRGTTANRSRAADDQPITLSLDQYLDDAGYEGRPLIDETSDVEANYIAGIERGERRVLIKKALASLTPEQRELLIRVRVKGVSISSIAREQMVDESAVRRRVERIEKKLRKISNDHPN